MQAFLWRHLVPAEELKVLVYDASYTPPPKRPPRVPPAPAVETKATPAVGPKAAPAVEAKAAPAVETKATPAVGPKATPAVETKAPPAPAGKLTFTKQQVAGRLRQLKFLFEEGLLTDDFYDRKVAECETAQ
jgi:cytoskeletal protein RodZ